MQRKVRHPNRLRILVKEAGLNIREVHRETNIPESTLHYWGAGNGVIPKEDRATLAHVIGCSASDLGPNYDMLESLCESDFSALGKEMIIKRRELLQLLGVVGDTLFIPDIDWNHIEASLTKPAHIDIAVINDLETINTRCWSLFMAASSKSSVLDGVLGQLKMQIQFLKEAQTQQAYQRLCALTSCISQLAGEIFFDLHDHNTARSCYVFAATSAKEAKTYDLWASALVRHSYLPLFDERYEDASALLKQAEKIAQRGDPALPTKYWAAATFAEAEAGVGSFDTCQSAFERAYAISNLTEEGPAWIRFEKSRLPALQGACYVRLDQPTHAEPMLQKALQEGAKTSRRRAMILSDLALSALQRADVERACTYADEAITLTASNSSGFLRHNIFKIKHRLTSFANVEAVRKLEERVALLA